MQFKEFANPLDFATRECFTIYIAIRCTLCWCVCVLFFGVSSSQFVWTFEFWILGSAQIPHTIIVCVVIVKKRLLKRAHTHNLKPLHNCKSEARAAPSKRFRAKTCLWERWCPRRGVYCNGQRLWPLTPNEKCSFNCSRGGITVYCPNWCMLYISAIYLKTSFVGFNIRNIFSLFFRMDG